MNQGLAVIAGASTELGSRIARQICPRFQESLLLGTDSRQLDRQIQRLNALGCKVSGSVLDLDSPSELWRVVERERGKLEQSAVLVCVGTGWDGGLSPQLSFEQFCPEAISSACAAQLASILAPTMIRRRYGRVLFVAPEIAPDRLPGAQGCGAIELPGQLHDLAKQVGRSRITVNSIAVTHTGPGPALDAMVRQMKHSGINRAQLMRFLCACERQHVGSYRELIPAIAGQLMSREAEFINGMCFLLPLLSHKAAA